MFLFKNKTLFVPTPHFTEFPPYRNGRVGPTASPILTAFSSVNRFSPTMPTMESVTKGSSTRRELIRVFKHSHRA